KIYVDQNTVLLGKSEAGYTAWLPWKSQLGRWRRFPVVASYDSGFRFQWAQQLIGTSNEGFVNWADGQWNPYAHGKIHRLGVDSKGNTFFGGRVAAGQIDGGKNPGTGRSGVTLERLFIDGQVQKGSTTTGPPANWASHQFTPLPLGYS